jgi:predicted negative regulator of RcsB-dependent stress response
MAAQPHKRITRKQIRRPDHFIVLLGEALDFVKKHKTHAMAAVGAAAVIVAGLGAWSVYSARQHRLAAAEYTRAVDLFHERRYNEALEGFARVATVRSTIYASLGRLYQAQAYANLNDTRKAAETLRQVVDGGRGEPMLIQIAYISLAHFQEEMRQWPEATQSYAAAEKLAGPFKADAVLGRARAASLAGDPRESIAAYRLFLTENPDSERRGEIALRIQELESKVSEDAKAAK